MENSLTTEEALARLEEPFASKDVKWLVAVTSRDGRKGRVTPYADPRAYTDRLNQIFTSSGWTRQYNVHTVSPLTRIKTDKTIQTGKVLVTCTVSISGVGTNSGTREEWADDENAMTSADALGKTPVAPGIRRRCAYVALEPRERMSFIAFVIHLQFCNTFRPQNAECTGNGSIMRRK